MTTKFRETLRVGKRERFVMIDQQTIRDPQLSFRALGLLAWYLDRPPTSSTDAKFAARGVGREGRSALEKANRELIALGYLIRDKVQDEHGRWYTATKVCERPYTASAGAPTPECFTNSLVGPATEKPAPVEPTSVSQLVKKEIIRNTVKEEIQQLQPLPVAVSEDLKEEKLAKVAGQERVADERRARLSESPFLDQALKEQAWYLCYELHYVIETLRDREGMAPPEDVTEPWFKQALRLLESDGRTALEALALIRWCEEDEDQLYCINTMGNFRAKYNSLMKQAGNLVKYEEEILSEWDEDRSNLCQKR